MREKLNSNPLAQAALVGVLLIVVGFFLMSTMGKGGEEETAATPRPKRPSSPGPAKRDRDRRDPGEAVEVGAVSPHPKPPPARPRPSDRRRPKTPRRPRSRSSPPTTQTRPSSSSSSATAASTTGWSRTRPRAVSSLPDVSDLHRPRRPDRTLRLDHRGRCRRPRPGAGRRPAEEPQGGPARGLRPLRIRESRERRSGGSRRWIRRTHPRLSPIGRWSSGTTRPICDRFRTRAMRPAMGSTPAEGAPARRHAGEPRAESASRTARTRRPAIAAGRAVRCRAEPLRRPTRRSRRSTARSGSPSRKRGSTRAAFVTDVLVELGYVSEEVVKQAIEAARTAGRPPGAAAARAGGDHPRPALARGRRALRPRPRRPLRLQGRHGGGEPDPGHHRPPLQRDPGRLRRQARRCWWRWPTRPTSSRSTTSRSRPGSTAVPRSPPRKTSRR